MLDVCCGSGASAIPAAEAVGLRGSVLGVDLAANLLVLARATASARNLRNVEFRSGEMLDLGLSEASFDAVVCVFGIFFVPDMPAAVRALGRLVRPGGRLALARGSRPRARRLHRLRARGTPAVGRGSNVVYAVAARE